MENNNLIWIIIGAVVVVGIGFFVFNSNNQSTNMENEEAMEMAEKEMMEKEAMEKEKMEKAKMEEEKAMVEEEQTIVDIAASNPDFSTLVTAVTEAGLVETLSGEGPFTVFAPTNAAFEKLPEGTLEAVLNDKDQLTAILTYHVVPGEVASAQVVTLNEATTVQGQSVQIEVVDGQVKINDATVVIPDIEASNGVIHVIDSVLIPE